MVQENMSAFKGDRLVMMLGLVYLLVVNIPHTMAAQYILSGLMLLVFVFRLFRREVRFLPTPAVGIWFYAVVLACVLSAILSPYQQESFSLLKKEVVPYFLAFVLIGLQAGGIDDKRQAVHKVLFVVVCAFVVRTLLAAWDFAANGYSANVYLTGSLPKYLDYYAIDSVLYFPIALGSLLFIKQKIFFKIVLVVSLIIAGAIIFLSQIRTAFLLCLLTVFVMLILRFWLLFVRHKFVIALIALAFSAAVIYQRDAQIFSRYKTILDPQGYSNKAEAMSGRYPIWLATIKVTSESPWFGYGRGWKKLPLIAEDLGLLSKWQGSQDPLLKQASEYFKLGPGVVNPHNLYILIFFEVGIVGLFAFLCLLSAMFLNAISNIRLGHRSGGGFHVSVGLIVIFYLINYMLLGVTNGIWFAGSFLAILIITALMGCKISDKK